MSLEILVPLIVAGVLLTLGFFLVRGINRHVVITMLGTHLRTAEPVAYWSWTIYYYVSLVFDFALAIAIIIGLSTD